MKKLHSNQDEFIAVASHQLRTPATAVKQYLAMLMDGYAGNVTDAQQQFLQKAYESNERQLSTINDLLHVAQLDADAIMLDMGKVDLGALLQDVVREQRPTVDQRAQQLLVNSRPKNKAWVWGDGLRLRMAFDNLVDNASKYAPEHTTIHVGTEVSDKMITVSITDAGVGIAKADFPRLFKKFSRINNPRSILVGGTGLGLYVAKRIIDSHRGNIQVTSEVGKGSTFMVALPLHRKAKL